MNYKILYDYHTHTVYSHGKGTIEDNVRTAVQKGLRGIAISDHGPGHLFYGVKKGDVGKMRGEIERLKGVYRDMDIFLSVEANIVNTENGLDVARSEFEEYDFVAAGYHYGVKDGYVSLNLAHHYSPMRLPGYEELKRKNTEMAVRAVYENRIKIFTHPGDKGPFDVAEIAKACAARGTLMEINNRHGYLTADDIRRVAGTGVEFIIGSDAHSPENIGCCGEGIKAAMEAGIDMRRVVNAVECSGFRQI